MSPATVDVIIPVRDGERYLAEAIESALAQTSPALHVVVIDDGSTDGSRAIAESYRPRVRSLAQEPSGIGAARNAGVACTSGQYLTFLDGDDRWPADRIEHQVAAMQSDPTLDVVCGHARQFISPDLDLGAARTPTCLDEPEPAYVPGTMLMRRTTWDRVGSFRTDLTVSEGLDWILRARELGCREAMLDEVVLERRLHERNNGRVYHDSRGEFARTLKASLDRRRSAAG